ncbi:MAG: Lrp/AsnC family transcriptional regulator [Bacteroidota bacterium]
MTEKIDEIDVQIVQLLQARGRIKRNQIAEEVGLSVPSVSERMRKLEERGVIQGYHAVLDHKRLHLDITAFIRVTVDGSTNYPRFIEQARALASILEVHSMTGEGSHLLKVRVRNTAALEQLLAQIQQWEGVHGTSTSLVLSTYKETREVPVEPMVLFQG